jgi:Flp pilus assembly protein TadG
MTSKLISGEQGSTIIETAVSITVLLTMIIGVMVGGLMVYTYHYLSYAARVGSRYAMVRGSACDNSNRMPDCPNVTSAQVQAYVKSVQYMGINPTLMTVTAAWPNGTKKPGDLVNVTVQYSFPFSVPFIPSRTVTMNSSSQAVISQ